MSDLMKLRPEQWTVAASLAILGIVGIIKAFTLIDPAAEGPAGKMTPPPEHDVTSLSDLQQRWNSPPKTVLGDHQVFVSRLIVYQPSTGQIGFLGAEEKTSDGITVAWKQKNGFPLDDPGVASADSDQDGFSNLEEFSADTNPNDKEDHPPFVQKLCLSAYEYVPFRLIFRGYSPRPGGDGYVFQVNLLDVQQRKTRMIEKGQDLEGYLVGDFREKIIEVVNERTGIKERRDVSELDIINPSLNEPVTLVLNKETESDESKVTFRLNVPGESPEPSTLKRGGKFKIRNTEFQLLKATSSAAEVREVATGQVIQIPACP